MPNSKNYVRDYQQENKYKKKPDQIKKRSCRNAARRKMISKLGKSNLKGKHIDHKDGNPCNNNPSNLVVKSASKNTSFARNKKAGKKNKSA